MSEHESTAPGWQEALAVASVAKPLPQTQADALVELVLRLGAELWRTPADVPYATVALRGRREHLPVTSTRFRSWLRQAYFRESGKAVRREAIGDALGVLEGTALEGPEHEVFVRVAAVDGRIYLDLADDSGRVVEMSADGWCIVTEAPVRFLRPSGSLPLPAPERGGAVEELRALLNLPKPDGFALVVGWMLGALHPRGPYAVLAMFGEAGTAKSTNCKILVALLDPKDVPLRREPREERDLGIAARHGRLVAFNNLSHLSPAFSDALAALATEGGFVTRTLYSDDLETRFKERRPLLLNGIPDVVARGDLADRAIKLTCPVILPPDRRTEEEVMAELERVRPRALGALLDAVACSLKNLAGVVLRAPPRMADFARWVTAAEPALGWQPGTFLAAYRQAIAASSAGVLEGDPVADALTRLLRSGEWTGPAGELLAALARVGADAETESRAWPRSARALSTVLRRLAPDLRRAGYTVEERSKDRKTRLVTWHLVSPPEGDRSGVGSDASHASHPSQAASDGSLACEGAADADGGNALNPYHPTPQGEAPARGARHARRAAPALTGCADATAEAPTPRACGHASTWDGWQQHGCLACRAEKDQTQSENRAAFQAEAADQERRAAIQEPMP